MLGLCELSSASVWLEVFSKQGSLHKCKQSRVQGIGVVEILCQSPKAIAMHWVAMKCFGLTFVDHQNQQKNHRFVPWLMFVKVNFVWMRIIRVPRETDFACYLIKPRRNCFQVNSAFNFGVCEHIAPCFNFSKVKCESWILTSILKSSRLINIIGTIVILTNDISYCHNIKKVPITEVLVWWCRLDTKWFKRHKGIDQR